MEEEAGIAERTEETPNFNLVLNKNSECHLEPSADQAEQDELAISNDIKSSS
jgi:hypothetical protein